MLESRKMWALLVMRTMKASPVEFGEDFESFEEPTSLASQMLTTLFQVRVEKKRLERCQQEGDMSSSHVLVFAPFQKVGHFRKGALFVEN